MTFEEFKVALEQLHNAIGSVRREHAAISDATSAIGSGFGAVKDAWGTPSTATYDDVQTWFMRVSNDLEDLLNDMANRLQTAYNNYKQAEETNAKNLTPQGGHPSTHHTDSVQPGNHGADRHVVTHHGEQDPAATLRETTRRTDPDIPAAFLGHRVSMPPNSG